MFRHTTYGLLAVLLLTASLHAQEPVFGLSEYDSYDDPADALAPSFTEAEFTSFSGGGLTHGGYADNHYYDHGAPGGCASCDSGYGCSSCGDCSACCGCGCSPTIWRLRSSSVYMSRESSDDTLMAIDNTWAWR